MKKLSILSLITLLFSTAAMAQKILPKTKNGSSFTFDLNYHGQNLDLGINIKTGTDPIDIDWNVSGTGGTYAIKVKALENGTKFGGDQPQPDAVTALADDETFMCISKAAYQSLVKNKTFTYGPLTYNVKDDPNGFKIGDKTLDATFVSTADGKTSMWILNDPDLPLTLSMQGNPIGVDYKMVAYQ